MLEQVVTNDNAPGETGKTSTREGKAGRAVSFEPVPSSLLPKPASLQHCTDICIALGTFFRIA